MTTERFVTPKVYLVGMTTPSRENIIGYLQDTGQDAFINDIHRAPVEDNACMLSMFAKLCYDSLVLGHNPNVTKLRSIEDNIEAVLAHGHGSVLEHVSINLIIHNCSRIFTHELVRHRVGTAFSQTSGRYCRHTSPTKIVFDPILSHIAEHVEQALEDIDNMYDNLEFEVEKELGSISSMSMPERKRITSALRRFLPEGRPNHIAFTLNVRALRHLLALRTSTHAEWEMQEVFTQIGNLCRTVVPSLLADATLVTHPGGTVTWSGMTNQPYDKEK